MEILVFIFAVFALLGAADCVIGNKFGIGKEFEKGISSLSPLTLSMLGMICISPVIAKILIPIITPLSSALRFDPSVIIGSILANDMGGAPLALEISKSPFWGYYNGLIVGGMLGVTVSFTIPVALKTIDKKFHEDVLLGILCGICTIPFGAFIAGLILRAKLTELILNLLPVIIISAIVSIGILRFQSTTVKIFSILGKIISSIIALGLGCGIFETLTGIVIIPEMISLSEGFTTIFGIAIVLSGVFPLIYVLSRIMQSPLLFLGKRLGISATAILGLISSLANSIPMFKNCESMDRKGRIINMAFAVSAAFSLGDHLAFSYAFNSDFAFAMVIGKIFSGILAVIAALLLLKIKQN